MGGTSLLFTGIALGMLVSASRGEIDKDMPATHPTHNGYKAKKLL
jgi:hypothetical protein